MERGGQVSAGLGELSTRSGEGALAEEARRAARPFTAESLQRAALDYLARYASSAAHLRQLLLRRVRRRGGGEGDAAPEAERLVDGVIQRLVQAGLLDDAAHAAMRKASLRGRGGSARAIRLSLAKAGIARELADAVLAPDSTADELVAAIAYARRRRLGPFRPPDERAGRRVADMRALARAGFDYDVARVVVDAADPEALAGSGAVG
jgi:regulatory protein